MALISEENTGTTEGRAINLKLVAVQGSKVVDKEADAPKFVVKAKNESTGNYELTDEKYREVSGVIQSITSTHNGKSGHEEVKGFKICLKDEGEMYYIETTMSNASKDIANSIIKNVGEYVKITVYLNSSNYPASIVKDKEDKHVPQMYAFSKDKKELESNEFTYGPGKQLDKNALWNEIKSQESSSDEEISPEDIAF